MLSEAEENMALVRRFWEARVVTRDLDAVEEKPSRRLSRHTLYPFINTHSAEATPKKGYTAEEVSRAYPEFANLPGIRRRTRSSLTR